MRFRILLGCAIVAMLFSACRPHEVASTSQAQWRPDSNVFGARQLDAQQAQADVNRAWDAYIDAARKAGGREQKEGVPIGFTEAEIEFIERETRQKLPEDLKAFMRVCWTDGKFFNDGYEIMSPDDIVNWWKFLVDLNYVNCVNGNAFHSPAANMPPGCFEPYMIPLMRYDVYEIHFDIRNGNIIELMDGPCGVMANSMVELLDGLTKEIKTGNSVCLVSFDGEEIGPFLTSEMWDVYDK